jgi:hypothetical protein
VRIVFAIAATLLITYVVAFVVFAGGVEFLKILVIGFALAVAFAALGGANVLRPRMALFTALGLLLVAVAGVFAVLRLPEVERLGNPLGYLLLSIPLAFAFFAFFATASHYESGKPMTLLITVPISFFVGLGLAISLGIGLGVFETL